MHKYPRAMYLCVGSVCSRLGKYYVFFVLLMLVFCV